MRYKNICILCYHIVEKSTKHNFCCQKCYDHSGNKYDELVFSTKHMKELWDITYSFVYGYSFVYDIKYVNWTSMWEDIKYVSSINTASL